MAAGSSHQAPDVRHGPRALLDVTAGHPAAIDDDVPGRPRSTSRASAIGGRNRRSTALACAIRPPKGGSHADIARAPEAPRQAATAAAPHPGQTGASRIHPADACRGATGEPQRDSPTSAPSRAVSVASVSGDGRARSSSEYWSDARRRRIDFDRDDVDRRRGRDAIRDRAAAACAALADRASRPATAACAHASVRSTSRRSRRIAAARPVRALERRGQRIEQAREHERQRLERVDRPLELDAFDESRHVGVGHERPAIEPARHALQGDTCLSQPRRQAPARQRRELAERCEPPPLEGLERLPGSRMVLTGRRSQILLTGADLADRCSFSRDADLADRCSCHGTRISRISIAHETSRRRGFRQTHAAAPRDARATAPTPHRPVTTVRPGYADDSSIAPICVGRRLHAIADREKHQQSA